jgi:CO/xanthine dehydrogenase Mo-binding subunit
MRCWNVNGARARRAGGRAGLITGEGNYGDDHAPAGCLHAALLRSPHAHATFTTVM